MVKASEVKAKCRADIS